MKTKRLQSGDFREGRSGYSKHIIIIIIIIASFKHYKRFSHWISITDIAMISTFFTKLLACLFWVWFRTGLANYPFVDVKVNAFGDFFFNRFIKLTKPYTHMVSSVW